MKINQDEQSRMNFVLQVIQQYKSSELYLDADISDQYAKQQNVEAVRREKFYRDIAGKLTKDEWTPNHRIKSNYFDILTTQLNQFLLGNGVTLKNAENKAKLGKDFDVKFNQAGKKSLTKTLSFIFWNFDHIEVFSSLEFAPLWNDEFGALQLGVRFWQIDDKKPLRATFYEEDGFTEYIWDKDKDGNYNGAVLHEKRPYNITVKVSDIDGTQIIDGQNYPSFPIVPLWANSKHLNELKGIKDHIDTIDELVNSLNDDLVEAQLYWLISGADGMDKSELTQMMQDLRNIKVANPADGQTIQPYTVSIPYAERQAEIERLDRQIYKDFQALNIDEVKGGAVTATQIKAAYEPLNHKADDFEMCVLECLYSLFKVVGIEDEEPTFTRSMLINANETIQAITTAAGDLSQEYRTKKILTVLGDGDKFEDVMKQITAENAERMGMIQQAEQNESEETENVDIGEAVEQAEKIGGQLNGAQTQSLISVVQQYSNGTLTEGQAANIISKAIGVTRDEALEIINS